MRWIVLVVMVLGCGASATATDAEPETFKTPTAALLPIQDLVGDTQAAIAVEQELLWQLRARSLLTGTRRTRDLMRRNRVRNGDDEDSALLKRLAEDLDVGWLVSVTIHDAERNITPRMALSARAYDGRTGEIFWASFQSSSGLDHRSVLEYGVVRDLGQLGRTLVERLMIDLRDWVDETPEKVTKKERRADSLSPLAIVPFTSITKRDATLNADTITQLARTEIHQQGIQLVPAGCTSEVLRRRRIVGWGAVDQETRQQLQDECGAEMVVTGTVERYDVGGAGGETQPFVAFGIRLVRADTGQILWTKALERRGWGRQSVFRFGRTYSRGELSESMMKSMIEELTHQVPRRLRREEKERE